ncbi:MAG: DUF3536 domain-containing protein [Desulfovibrionales bacterium]|nr:DUF3536 domain-containing protein [Desulfovibrionales bacterium]
MSRLCIHGHFYQPPRFDPWLEEVLPEASAAPFHNWNERICRECYFPLAYARRMDSNGYIYNMINCYEYMSFNFGPTILSWMERHSPDTYKMILDGDRKSVEHFGHGNAMAQVYHHIIMPLSTDHDREVEINWSLIDFEHRYGRKAEGMWLAETAVCTETLESLARAGLKFTILAPRQAEAVAGLEDENWHKVDEGSLDTSKPYLVKLPSGNEISVFFYDGPLSQAVAFEKLLQDGRGFWERLLSRKNSPLISLATDGESYGHHFKFGEMALAYVLEQAQESDSPLTLTNYASYLNENPPEARVRIGEKTSWSCIHGIERWREDCGCKDGGHADWNQQWRKPLRRSLNLLKYYIDEYYRNAGPDYFKDEVKALMDYGRCLCGAVEKDDFLQAHQSRELDDAEKVKALKLLEMQRVGLASFASCAWFFDDIARIEPLNALSYALRGMEMLKDLGGPDVEAEFLEVLEEAYSNNHNIGDGREIWSKLVKPRRIGAAQMALTARAIGALNQDIQFPGLNFKLKSRQEHLELFYEWNKTGENGQALFKTDMDKTEGGCPSLITEDGEKFDLQHLDVKLQDHILCRLDQSKEHELWTNAQEQYTEIQSLCFRPFEEGQHVPLAGTRGSSLIVVFQFIISEKQSKDFETYWKEVFKYNPFFREILEERISIYLKSKASEADPIWKSIALVFARSKRLGIYPDLFFLQNRLWHEHLEDADSEVFETFLIRKDAISR